MGLCIRFALAPAKLHVTSTRLAATQEEELRRLGCLHLVGREFEHLEVSAGVGDAGENV